MIDRDEDIRECWAYSKAGQKCSHPAGHPGDHAIIITWTDDECWKPGAGETPKPKPPYTVNIPAVEHLIDVDMRPDCEICSHPADMHSNQIGECVACDCKSYIG